MDNSYTQALQELNELYVDIALSAEFDFKVTIDGNGCNAFEVSHCIDKVFGILGISKPIITEEMKRDYLIACDCDPEDYI